MQDTNARLRAAVNLILKGKVSTAHDLITEVIAENTAEQKLKRSFDSFYGQLKNKSKDVELLLTFNPKAKILGLEIIVVPNDQKRQGKGTALIKEIIQWATNNKCYVAVTPAPIGDKSELSKTQLTDYYKKLGFKPNKGKYKNFETQKSMILDLTQ